MLLDGFSWVAVNSLYLPNSTILDMLEIQSGWKIFAASILVSLAHRQKFFLFSNYLAQERHTEA
jgi:hypothetical protein